MDSIALCKLNLESIILATAEKYLPQLNLVLTVPGIQSFAAIGVISEIGVDMSVFPTSKQLCSWAGLTPQNNESAGKKKTSRISRAGSYIKPLLGQCALCAIRTKKNPEIRSRYLLKKMNLTTLTFTTIATGHRSTARCLLSKPSLFYKGRATL